LSKLDIQYIYRIFRRHDYEHKELWTKLDTLAAQDTRYQQALEKVSALEPAYLAIKNTLSPEQQQALDDYITACEVLDECQLWLALHLLGSNLSK